MKTSACHAATSAQRVESCGTVPPLVASPRIPWVTRLRRHLGIALVAKLALLALLYVLFFSPAQRPHLDAGRVADRILSPR